MDYIQKKTADHAVEHFLLKAADQEVSLPWDRYEGQLPECGFCEAGLSCRDCLQGPCISHPFRDTNKIGICGKDKDTLAVQSLLRLVLKGTMALLDQASEFATEVANGAIDPQDKENAEQIARDIQSLLTDGAPEAMKSLPEDLAKAWTEIGILPEGIARDLLKASQKLEGGISGVEHTLLWAFKSALSGYLAQWLQGKLKQSVFGSSGPTAIDVNLGVLQKDTPNILFCGTFSPVLRKRIAEQAKEKNMNVLGVCSDPLLPPFTISPVSNYGAQDIALMTGAIDLIVAGEHYVNPSLKEVAKEWNVKVVPVDGLKAMTDLAGLAEEIIVKAQEAFDIRRDIPRDIPDAKESATLGYSPESLDLQKIVDALDSGAINGIAVFAGSNNIKYTQDKELTTIVETFLAKNILCLSDGDASVGLAKYGFLDPKQEKNCGDGVKGLLAALGDNVPSVIDCDTTEFLLALSQAASKSIKEYPIVAYFAEANRSTEVVKAMAMVAMGVSTYFWPSLPVTGSQKTMSALTDFCNKTFGAKFNVVTARIEAPAKAKLFLNEIDAPAKMSGKEW